ncbi:MAG: glycosyltransferase family 4 protein [Bacteroidales bacterium]|nr:glycosyltransferase family 4 protein [Bacteroidales bacterium]
MRILFVCSGNSKDFRISPFIKTQGDSLERKGIKVEYFTIKRKGVLGYLKSIPELSKYVKNNKCDLIHAHYALSGWVALLGGRRKLVICSYMGSDIYGDINKKSKRKLSSYREIILAKLLQRFLSGIIVKSENLLKYIWYKKNTIIIPNGIDESVFKELNKANCRKELGLNQSKKYILFLGNRNNSRKNYPLLESASKILDNSNIEILIPYPVKHEEIPIYLNAVDLFVLTSFREGSPNVVKEAMACNCPIVSTNVGDVDWLLGEISGHFITSFDPLSMSKSIRHALQFAKEVGKTRGRERIFELGLDSERISKRIIQFYNNSINNH